MGSASDNRAAQQAEASYNAVAARDPLYAPHASLAFEVLGKLGEGGMGAVFEVRDQRHGRQAALKVLHAEGADEESQRRFLREARLTARLDHPCIPPVYEIGRTPRGELYLLMRHIRGQTLKEELAALRSRPGTRRQQLQAVVKVAEALAYAHSQGVVHRDVKPSNIMVGPFGEVLLMDWGVAKDLRALESEPALKGVLSSKDLAATGLTLAGAVVGTPGYMAPEQARGEAVDERADVYALGLLLGEVLTGEPLVGGEASLIRHVANAEGRTRLAELSRRVPGPLRWVLSQALCEDPEARTENAGVFADQLQAWLADEEVPGYRGGWGERALRRVKRNPTAMLGLLGGLVLLTLAGLLVEVTQTAARRGEELAQAKRVEASAKAEAERAQRVLGLFNRAREHARRGLTRELEETLERAVAEGERSLEALMTAGRIAAEAGESALARRMFREAAEAWPPAYSALYEWHVLDAGVHSLGATEAMSALLERAEARGDESEYAWIVKGARHQREGDLEGALAAYDAAERLNRRLPALYNLRGRVRGLLGDEGGAREDFARALELDPQSAMPHFNLARLEFERGDLKAAERGFTHAIELAPTLSTAYSNRAAARTALGDGEGSSQDLTRALELDPESVEALTNRGILRALMGQSQAALEDYRQAAALAPDEATIFYNRGNLYRKLGQHDPALADYDRAVALDPKYARAFNNRATLKMETQDFAGAEADLDRALALDPKDGSAFSNRGFIKLRRGDARGAKEDLDAALEVTPRLAIAWLHRGRAMAQLGEAEVAIADLERFLELAPRHPGAAEVRELVEDLRGGSR